MLLVAGGAGFIGSIFILDWLAEHEEEEVVVVVNRSALIYAGNQQNLASLEGDARYVSVHGDTCDRVMVDDLLVRIDHGLSSTLLPRAIRIVRLTARTLLCVQMWMAPSPCWSRCVGICKRWHKTSVQSFALCMSKPPKCMGRRARTIRTLLKTGPTSPTALIRPARRQATILCGFGFTPRVYRC